MSVEQHQEIAAEVFAALEANQLELPTLPDIALKLGKLIDDPNVSADQLVNLLSSDPAISAHLIKAANSAALSSGKTVDNVRSAISRLGYRMLRNMVITITMNKLFRVDSPLINQQLKELWEHSREVAANSYVLALQQKHLRPEQAMLAGLVHDIGVLPLCLFADRYHPRIDQESLNGLARKFATKVGTKVLEYWHFPEELVAVVAGHENLQRNNASQLADYVDIVMMANLQMPGTAKFVAWEKVSAASKLGYSTADSQNFLATQAEQLAVARSMLGIDTDKSTRK